MIASLATLAVGIMIGYWGQRSRFCTISAFRDGYILKDFYRIKGLLGIIIGGVIGYTAFWFIGGDVPNFPIGIDIEVTGYLFTSMIGGLGIGFFSVLAEGCPFRQHVMAAQGRESAMFYLLGFYIGIIYFYTVTIKFLELFISITS
jgi:hypothetical protein